MAVAMKDLEIRGAGNLLGGEQSGHIADVGFDLYVRLVGEAVHEFRGRRRARAAEVRIELPVDAHLPHDYIASERLRLEMYKRLAEVRCRRRRRRCCARSWSTATASRRSEVTSLLLVARFRARARSAGRRRGHHRRASTSGSRRSTLPESARGPAAAAATRRASSRRPLRTILVPRPQTAAVGGRPLAGVALLEWARTGHRLPSSTRRAPKIAAHPEENP